MPCFLFCFARLLVGCFVCWLGVWTFRLTFHLFALRQGVLFLRETLHLLREGVISSGLRGEKATHARTHATGPNKVTAVSFFRRTLRSLFAAGKNSPPAERGSWSSRCKFARTHSCCAQSRLLKTRNPSIFVSVFPLRTLSRRSPRPIVSLLSLRKGFLSGLFADDDGEDGSGRRALGPSLDARQASKLLVLMNHANTCPDNHRCPRMTDVRF